MTSAADAHTLAPLDWSQDDDQCRDLPPGPGDGRRPAGRQRPPRHGHEPGAGRLPALPEGHAPRPQGPGLARARPLRPVPRTLEPDAVQPAVPVGLRAHDGRPRGLPHVGQPHPRAPGARPHRRGRDDDRPARPGARDRRRHGHGRPLRARAARPRRARGLEPVRPPRLVHRRRRRPRGGHHVGGLLAGRTAEARPAGGPVRRQPHLHRGRHRDRVPRGRDGALPRLRVGDPQGGDERRRVHRRRRCARGDRGRADREGPPHLHPGPQHHRLAVSHPAEHRQGARQRARRARGAGHQGGAGYRPRPALRLPRRPPRPGPRQPAPPRRLPARRVGRLVRRLALRARGQRRAPRPPAGARPAERLRVRRAGLRRGLVGVHPQGVGRGDQRDRRRHARALGRIRRPGRVQQHDDRVGPELPARRQPGPGRIPVRSGAALRHPRARHGRDPQRDRARRPDASLRRHLPRVLGLHARRRAALGAHGHRRRRTSGRTTPSASARTAPPTSRSSTCGRCGPSPTSRSSAPRTPTRRRPPGGRPCTSGIQSAWC